MTINDEKKKSKKKEELLDAAKYLFVKRGIRKVTIEEIINEAEVSKGTFYKYFTDKKDILEKVLRRIFDELLISIKNTLEEARRNRLSQEKFLKIFDVNEYDHYFQSEFISDLVQEYPQLVAQYSSWVREERVPLYYELMRIAKIDGVIAMDIDIDLLVTYSFAMRRAMHEMINDNPYNFKSIDIKEHMSKFYDLYLNGVAKKS